MTGKVLGWAALVLHFAVVIFIGYGMQLPVQPPVKPKVAEAPIGPQCTPIYPRGFTVDRDTKRRKVNVCKNGDLQATWRGCTLRYNT